MRYRLPVKQIIVDALVITWVEKATLSRVLALPIFAIIILQLFWQYYVDSISNLAGWINYLIYVFLLVILFINCHRIFLLGKDSVPRYGFNINARILRFYFWLLVLALIAFISWYISIAIILTIFNWIEAFNLVSYSEASKSSKVVAEWISVLAYIPAVVIISRLILVLPSIAIDRKDGLLWSWWVTKENSWRMFVIVGVIPWLISLFISTVFRENQTAFESVAFYIITYSAIIIEVSVISLSYKRFKEIRSET